MSKIILEKNYERLDISSNINKNNYRDLNTLKMSFNFIKEKYNKNKDYSYIINQLKSIRQELLLQNIKNEFSINVYEESVKLAIENNDIPNLSISISYLINDLYTFFLNNNFIQFFRLYLIYTSIYDIKEISIILTTKHYKKNKNELKDIIKIIKFINQKSYINAIKEISLLKNEIEKKLFINIFPKIKLLSIIIMCYGYFTSIPILFIQNKLLFQNEKDCLKFLKEKNAIIDEELNNLLCRNSIKNLLNNQFI